MSTERTLDEMMGLSELPVEIMADGTVVRRPDIHSPECYVDVDSDGQCIGEPTVSTGWELLEGYTGQYGYNGAIMHASEYIGGRLEDDIRSTPGVYTTVTVECLAPSEDVDTETPAGWAVARRIES